MSNALDTLCQMCPNTYVELTPKAIKSKSRISKRNPDRRTGFATQTGPHLESLSRVTISPFQIAGVIDKQRPEYEPA